MSRIQSPVGFLRFVILSKRVTLPIVRTKDPAGIGMSFKFNAEHIQSFPFMPVRRSPDCCHRRNCRTFGRHHDLEHQSVPVPGGVKVIRHPERLFILIVHTAQAHERVKRKRIVISQIPAEGRYAGGSHGDPGLAGLDLSKFRFRFGKFLLQICMDFFESHGIRLKG